MLRWLINIKDASDDDENVFQEVITWSCSVFAAMHIQH